MSLTNRKFITMPLYDGFMLRIVLHVDGSEVGLIEGNRGVWHLEVSEQHRNNGHGEALLAEFTKHFSKPIQGYTDRENKAMIRVFEKCGYILKDEEDDECSRGYALYQ